jgi:integrase
MCSNNKGIISNVCKLAKSLQMIEINPAETVCLPKENRAEKVIYTREEMRELLSLLEKCDNPQLKLFANMAAYTGMRTAEMLGLEFTDIDFDKNTIRIHQQLVHTKEKGLHIYDETKNSKDRIITVPKSLIDLLNDWKRQRKCDSGIVFTENNGLMSKTRPRDWLQTFCKRNGIRYCSPHSFRHWHVTTLHKDGIDVAEIARRIGDEIATVLKVYLHAEKSADVEACAAIENALNAI